MKYIIIVALATFFIACQKDPIISSDTYACHLAFPENGLVHPKNDQFEEAMKKVQKLVPGVQVAIRSKDGNLWLGSQGLADIPNNIPFENCTKTMVGSVSKIYTAVLIMQLQEDSVLSITDPITNWIEADIINGLRNAELVSIQHLLKHTSGIRDYLNNEIQIDFVNNLNLKLTPREKLKYAYGKSPEFAPDEKYGYSNSNYVLLGLIIEKARNLSYKEAIDAYINKPLGFLNTEAGTPKNPIPTGTARPYLALQNGKYSDIMEVSVSDAATGDGAIATNAQEAIYFMEAIASNTIISKISKKMMLDQRTELGYQRLLGKDNWYGLGLEQSENINGFAFGHYGSTSAYWSQLFHFPENNVTFAISFNGDTEQEKEYKQLQDFIIEMINIAFE